LPREHLFDTVVEVPPSPPAAQVPATGSARPRQRSFDDLGVPLSEVTFCIVDVETTGGSAADGAITEIGAVKLRGGECLGTFQTLVNPGRAIPPQIILLTGITEAMVGPAPRMHEVLPAFLEFLGDAVLVGHNVRYDLSFLQAELERARQPPLANRSVDTCAMARRLVRDEVPNCKLSTLAERFRLPHRPSHRALDDALATGDLLHLLLERAATWGVLGLEDLLELPRLAGHPQGAKLRLTEDLPRAPGVYVFRDAGGRALYVGKATNLRSRVRSYFSGDSRRKVGALLREVHHIEHRRCHHALEAAVAEVRLIHELEPRYNRQATTWRRYVYLKLTTERFPRLSVVRVARADASLQLGPLPSTRTAQRVIEAVHTAIPLRRCSAKPPAEPRPVACTPAQLGVATCPCAGQVTDSDYALHVAATIRALTTSPSEIFAPLDARMAALAADERFEEAADTRDRAAAVASALRRQRRLDQWQRPALVRLRLPGGGGVELVHGRMDRAWGTGLDDGAQASLRLVAAPPQGPVGRDAADEVLCIAQFVERYAERLDLLHVDGELSSPLPALPHYEPGQRTASR
jgi:DNA polymerase-3 subunit epsilon